MTSFVSAFASLNQIDRSVDRAIAHAFDLDFHGLLALRASSLEVVDHPHIFSEEMRVDDEIGLEPSESRDETLDRWSRIDDEIGCEPSESRDEMEDHDPEARHDELCYAQDHLPFHLDRHRGGIRARRHMAKICNTRFAPPAKCYYGHTDYNLWR